MNMRLGSWETVRAQGPKMVHAQDCGMEDPGCAIAGPTDVHISNSPTQRWLFVNRWLFP